MKSGLTYLIAARQCEISELERLARTSALVDVIGRFVHGLQRERGTSNVYLASNGARFAVERQQQVAQCDALQQEVQAALDQLDADEGHVKNGARLFSRIAVVMYELDALPQLRHRIARQVHAPRDATREFARLIADLLAVVFEAADSAGDPEISRVLVALFNFMQGKEFAGQERALGAAVFASGRQNEDDRRQWRHLVEQQQACFQVFDDFADAQVLAADAQAHDDAIAAQVERLRRVGLGVGTGESLDPALSAAWFEACTVRIDAMRTVEDVLASHLRDLCDRRIAGARAELRDQQAIVDTLQREAAAQRPGAAGPYGPQLERSILDMVQEQAQRLQAMSDELDTVRGALNERKVIERAKGLLMAHRHWSEEEAYKNLREMAMNQKRRLVDVAEAVLAMADVLPSRSR